jgi:hypothetical protein
MLCSNSGSLCSRMLENPGFRLSGDPVFGSGPLAYLSYCVRVILNDGGHCGTRGGVLQKGRTRSSLGVLVAEGRNQTARTVRHRQTSRSRRLIERVVLSQAFHGSRRRIYPVGMRMARLLRLRRRQGYVSRRPRLEWVQGRVLHV